MKDVAISVTDLYKIYPNRAGQPDFKAVDGVSFEVSRGEIFGILGPNGAGKTTTLEIIEGIKQRTKGEVRVLGFDIFTQSAEVKKRIGVQLQSSEYLPNLSLVELLHLFGSFYGQKKRPAAITWFCGVNRKSRRAS